jgi:hypothetical protein
MLWLVFLRSDATGISLCFECHGVFDPKLRRTVMKNAAPDFGEPIEPVVDDEYGIALDRSGLTGKSTDAVRDQKFGLTLFAGK